jgi:hypothetical protein
MDSFGCPFILGANGSFEFAVVGQKPSDLTRDFARLAYARDAKYLNQAKTPHL